MTRGRAVIHGHFYQPLRLDPFTGVIPAERGALPFHDWNERIDAECYRPNGTRGNLGRISFDLGPTLASWLAAADPQTYQQFIAADRPVGAAASAGAVDAVTPMAIPPIGPAASPAVPSFAGPGNAMAQAYHHAILPLASMADRRSEIRWGLRDYELRWGRRPEGMWLPETAVDMPTLRILAEEGVKFTILAPWQAAERDVETRRPYRVALGGGRTIWSSAFADGPLSASVSFDPAATEDADEFARDHLLTRMQQPLQGGRPPGSTAGSTGQTQPTIGVADAPVGTVHDVDRPLVLIATDGELYGHHQKFRDLFLQRLVDPPPGTPDRGFDFVTLSAALAEPPDAPFQTEAIVERTSWSCHHGVLRWTAECPDAVDGRWKGPLRTALEILAGGIDTVTDRLMKEWGFGVDVGAARDAYIDVVFGAKRPSVFATRWLGRTAPADRRTDFLDLMEAQRWRLAMFASDGCWFWDDPIRNETKQNLRCAAQGRTESSTRSRGRASRNGSSTTSGSWSRRPLEMTAARSTEMRSRRSASRSIEVRAGRAGSAGSADRARQGGETPENRSARGLRTTGRSVGQPGEGPAAKKFEFGAGDPASLAEAGRPGSLIDPGPQIDTQK